MAGCQGAYFKTHTSLLSPGAHYPGDLPIYRGIISMVYNIECFS